MHPQKPFGNTHDITQPTRVLRPWEIKVDTHGTRLGLRQPTDSGAVLSITAWDGGRTDAAMSRDSLRALRDAITVVLGE